MLGVVNQALMRYCHSAWRHWCVRQVIGSPGVLLYCVVPGGR